MPESGHLIGPYRLISQLGRGAMGEVWRARDERLDRYVALKILPPDAAEDLERRARMLREARAAAAIRHPNVVTLYDIVSQDGDDLLVMELVEGRTLSEALRKDGPPPLDTALAWIHDIADALVTAHAQGILHRDIKAANVMVGEHDAIKVLDFGLAKLVRDSDASATLPLEKPSASNAKIALDETMPSAPATAGNFDERSYRTHAGQLIGTPLYMAPEQIDGSPPDERTEVFSVGVLAHEIFAGKPPYTAVSMDELFRQIQHEPPPALPNAPEAVQAIIRRALEKDPSKRYQRMRELRDAIAALRAPPRARRWPLVALAALVVVVGGLGIWQWRAHRPAPTRPGDEYVARALDEYELFYNDKAMSSLRAALRVAPDHPRANAYVILLGFGSDADRDTALAASKRALANASGKDRALLDAALALVEQGPKAAREAIGNLDDRELAFWRAELDYRAGNFDAAAAAYKALLDNKTTRMRGRIYDHYSFLLLGLDDPQEAKRIGTLYRDAFPGEADAIGVYATTLSAAGEHEAAVAAAEDALRLAEGEDTLAGLAKVVAYKGDLARARELYQHSLDRAPPGRRPIRRAALALLQFMGGDVAAAKTTIQPCLPGGADAQIRERGACLFVAAVVDPALADGIADELDRMAAAGTALHPAYGRPDSLAKLVRARKQFFGGGCVVSPEAAAPPTDLAAYDAPLDFYAAYHVPFFATWAACEHAAALAAKGDKAGAATLLEPIAARGNRPWITAALARYR